MSEQKKKVIFVSNKVNEKIAEELRVRLEAQGIEVEVKDRESMTKEEIQEIEVVLEYKEPMLSESYDDMLLKAGEKVRVSNDMMKYDNKKQNEYASKKRVPRKIGKECKEKVKNIRGKRYGR